MDIEHQRCAGMDISKRDAKVCFRLPADSGKGFTHTVSTYGSTYGEVLRLRADLEACDVTIVVMEATSDYWKPFFFVLNETLNTQLVNAHQARNLPGRKTDVSDAMWLAQLAAHGLLAGSFVPPEPIRRLRELTRMRTSVCADRSREYARLEKDLEDSGIKLSSVASTLATKSARAILEALLAGERDPKILADLAHTKMRNKTDQLVDALVGRFTDHHGFMVRLHLDRIDHLDHIAARLDAQIDQVIDPFRPLRDQLIAIPGISVVIADVIIAEIGDDMSVFPTSGHLASWAGVAPGHNESAGVAKSAHTRPGNKHLKNALGTAALTISRSNTTSLAIKYRRIRSRAGAMKAIVAIERTLLTIIWNMLTNGEIYQEKGPDFYDKIRPTKAKNRALRQLEHLGYNVTITPAPAA